MDLLVKLDSVVILILWIEIINQSSNYQQVPMLNKWVLLKIIKDIKVHNYI